jgi:hypothetical protein
MKMENVNLFVSNREHQQCEEIPNKVHVDDITIAAFNSTENKVYRVQQKVKQQKLNQHVDMD